MHARGSTNSGGLGQIRISANSVQEIARQAEVNANTLYRTLSEQGNPELKTLSAILKAMGMRLAVQPIHEHA